MTDLATQPIADVAARIASRDLSPVDVVRAVLDRIAALEPVLASYVVVDGDRALDEAAAAESEIVRSGPRGLLHGIPVAVKDCIAVAGWLTTNGSPLMSENLTMFDAAVVERLRSAGAIILGKSAMHEWAMGGTCIRQPGGPVRNPWALDHVPGGSSGGSAAAVASGLAYAAVGTDGMGSIRTPASYCGVIGLKPTYGLVSRFGEIPATTSQTDHVGPITRTVQDARIMLRAIAGHDPRDATSLRAPAASQDPLVMKDLRIGLVRSPLDDDVTPAVNAAVALGASALASRGAEITEVSLPSLAMMPLVGPALRTEVQDFLLALALQYPGGFANPDIRARVLAAEFVTADDVRRARNVCAQIRDEVGHALDHVDALLLPTNTTPAFPMGAASVSVGHGETVDLLSPGGQSRITTRLTHPFNIVGVPAISLPAPVLVDGLPVGIQLVGRRWQDERLLEIAGMLEAEGASWRTPPVARDAT